MTTKIRDIGAPKKTEKHPAREEARYRGLLEAAPDAMVVVNPDGEIVLLNVQAEKQFGYRRDELVGQKVKNIIPEGFAERLIADGTWTAAEALAQQIGTGIELTGRRKDRSEFPIEIMLSPLESADGVLVTAAIRDISVRKKAEKHLAQMEGRYRGLLEAAPDAMVVVNTGGEIVLLNVQAEKQFGYRRDELLGQKVKNIIPEGFAERLIADALRSSEDALAQQMGTGIELTAKRKDGSKFPIEIMLSPLESAQGVLITAAIRDISVRKKAEKHLAQVEAWYRGLMETAPDAMVISDLDGHILLVNGETERLFGYPRKELAGQVIELLVPERFRGSHPGLGHTYAKHSSARPAGESFEVFGLRKDATEFPVEIGFSSLETPEGLYIANTIRDITERKRGEQALRDSEERFRLMVSTAKDYAILMLDPEGRVVSWNEGAERNKGYRAEEIIGQHFSRFYPAEDVESGKPALELKNAEEQGFFENEGWRMRKDGSRFWANVVITALRDQNGRLRGFGKITRDITGRMKAEEALRGSEERFRMALEAAEMGTWFWNIQTDTMNSSEKCRLLLGVPPDAELTFQAFLNASHPDDRKRIDQSISNTLELGLPYDSEYRAVWSDGSVHWIAAKGRAHRNPEGAAVNMQGIVMDFTDRKESRAVLDRKSMELKRSNDDLQQFA